MKQRIALESYFSRIGCEISREASAENLRKLHTAHAYAIPFENLDSWTGRRVSVAVEDLWDKIVIQRRGGYCYEMNSLFAAVLRELGFSVTPMLAEVLWKVPEHRTAHTHLMLKVRDQKGIEWAVDVGFGGPGQLVPLRLTTDEEQEDTLLIRRLRRSDGYIYHEMKLPNSPWEPLYRFGQDSATERDIEIANWYMCTFPQSPFVTSLMVSIKHTEHFDSLTQEHWTRRDSQGATTVHPITSGDHLVQILSEVFGLPEKDSVLTDAKKRWESGIERGQLDHYLHQ